MQTVPPSVLKIISIGFLIVGNLIGAGILALPINTGLAGFVPSLIGLFVTSAAMYYSAVILGGEAARRQKETFNYPSLYQTYLGTAGKWVAVAANLVILYGLLTAYLTGITTIITRLLAIQVSPIWLMLGFFAITALISLASVDTIMKYISLLVVIKCAAFVVIAGMAGIHVRAENLAHTNWSLFVCGIPILVTAFHFHNIIPAICRSLQWDQRVINRTMLVGMVMGFLMNGTWLLVGIGVLPLDTSPIGLINAFQKNLPATVPLAEAIHSSTFLLLAGCFAVAAITTAYLSNGMGLIGFMDDLISHHLGRVNPLLSRAFSFGPPLLIALVYPDIFLKAIDIAGGFGIVTLFGILPCIIALRNARTPRQKKLGIAMLLLFCLFFLLEAGQELGMLDISAEIEHWK
ncbi:MAG: aromatic amino acid transport family protein [Desulfomicrobiaceae bacterium]